MGNVSEITLPFLTSSFNTKNRPGMSRQRGAARSRSRSSDRASQGANHLQEGVERRSRLCQGRVSEEYHQKEEGRHH